MTIRPVAVYLSILESTAWLTQFDYLAEVEGMNIPFGTRDLGNHGLMLKISSFNYQRKMTYLTIAKVFQHLAVLMTSSREFRTLQANVAIDGRFFARLVLQHAPANAAAALGITKDNTTAIMASSAVLQKDDVNIGGTVDGKFLQRSSSVSQPSNDTNPLPTERAVHCQAEFLENAQTLQSKDVFLGIIDNLIQTMPTDSRTLIPPFQYRAPEYHMMLQFASMGDDPYHHPQMDMATAVTMQRVMAKWAVQARRFAEMSVTAYELRERGQERGRPIAYAEMTRHP